MEPVRQISNLDWMMTPEAVKEYIRHLEKSLHAVTERDVILEDRTEKLETRVNQNSRNSSKPPSSDPPYSKWSRTFANQNFAPITQSSAKIHGQLSIPSTSDSRYCSGSKCHRTAVRTTP